ncbi:glycosyltransferase family 39 protein [Candidatus Bathyarchaeota archaeon A05DMB-2]|jgi:4-amino-4-deoxy-L-arabinose transferase-like glycosyltransferase|nr:glycosyltransferase family 39 protein [Candidatus Bathyarchaeota archaeon A05DMB-2]
MVVNHSPLIGILLGSALLSISLGPYSSWDSLTEFAAASGVVKWGFPYLTYGNLINMQPFGFYVDAVFLKIFGVSYETAVAVTTMFAVGCVFLTYKIGDVLYGRRTGLFAAALFALTPWHVIMSRVFLIDVQCLFFSLLYLLVGIWAIRRDSNKLFFAAGVIFGLALLTKLFAVFMLIPLVLFYIYSKPKNRTRVLTALLLFILPAAFIQYLWYEPISGRKLISLLNHDDFGSFLPIGFVPSPTFSLNFLSESLGIFFILGFFFSLALSFLQKKHFSKTWVFDSAFFASIVGVVGFNTYLVLGNNLLVPYVNSIKYDYLTLPLFCLIAASSAKKCSLLSRQKVPGAKRRELVLFFAAIGPYLLLMSMIFNFMTIVVTSGYEWLSFDVPGGLSYSFDKLSPVLNSSHIWTVQFSAFLLIQFSLLWANRGRLEALFASPKSIVN